MFLASSSEFAFAFFLWLSTMSKYSTDTTTHPSEHLCTKIATGHFDRIHIKSITVYSVRKAKNLLIFEGDKKHYVELSQITNSSMEMSLNNFRWDEQELRQGVQAMVQGKRLDVSKVSAIYMLYYGDSALEGLPGLPKGKWYQMEARFRASFLVVLLYTNSTVFSMDILPEKVDLFKDHQNMYPNFALLQYQPRKTKTIGFVIHKDIYGLTEQLVLYDMKYDNLMETVDIHRKVKVTQKERDNAKYYYLEKGRQARTVDLVPRSVRASNHKVDLAAQLIGSSVPRGFMLNGYLYLMDTHAGCVYVIGGNIASVELMKAYTEQPNKTLTFPVTGIPFESFFKCTGVSIAQPYPHQADRCEPKRNVAPVVRPLTVGVEENMDLLVTVLMPMLLLMLVLVGLCVTGWYCFFGQSPTDDVLPQGLDLKAVQAELTKRMKQTGKLGTFCDATSSVDNEATSTSKAEQSKPTSSNISSAIT